MLGQDAPAVMMSQTRSPVRRRQTARRVIVATATCLCLVAFVAVRVAEARPDPSRPRQVPPRVEQNWFATANGYYLAERAPLHTADVLVQLAVPKSATTLLRGILDRGLESAEDAPLLLPRDHSSLPTLLRRAVVVHRDEAGNDNEQEEPKTRGAAANEPPRIALVTVLRDPVDWMLSFHRSLAGTSKQRRIYQQRVHGGSSSSSGSNTSAASANEFLMNAYWMHNMFTRSLSGNFQLRHIMAAGSEQDPITREEASAINSNQTMLAEALDTLRARLTWFGIFDALPQSMRLLCYRFCWASKMVLQHKVTTANGEQLLRPIRLRARREALADRLVSPDARKVAEAKMQLDVALLREARSMLAQRLEEMERLLGEGHPPPWCPTKHVRRTPVQAQQQQQMQ